MGEILAEAEEWAKLQKQQDDLQAKPFFFLSILPKKWIFRGLVFFEMIEKR